MVGEQVAFRRAAVGVPITEYEQLIDRARINFGGQGIGNTSSSANLTNSTIVKTVTAHATPHTKGLYTELIASTPYAAETLTLMLTGPSASTVNTATLMDIAFGPDLTEEVKIANINLSAVGGGYYTIILPFAISAGTRISARIQSAVTVQAITLAARVHQAGDHSAAPTSCTTIGADTATSNGLAPTTATGTNTKAVWLEILASAAANYTRMFVSVGGTSSSNVTATTGLIDIGLGGVGVEAVIAGDIYYDQTSTERVLVLGNAQAFTVDIKPGDRLVIRYQCTSTVASARPTIILHLFR